MVCLASAAIEAIPVQCIYPYYQDHADHALVSDERTHDISAQRRCRVSGGLRFLPRPMVHQLAHGMEAMVKLMPHDSHKVSTDVYPLSFMQRVPSCVNVQAGIVVSRSANVKIAFCGRKHPGTYILSYVPKGFPGAHGSRHLYNMMGGRVYEVDFMSAVETSDPIAIHGAKTLALPSLSPKQKVNMIIPKEAANFIEIALDCLPWNSLSWSIHRGMRAILLGYGKPEMDGRRQQLADLLKHTVADHPQSLDDLGWNPTFVRQSIGDMAASAVLAGRGDSGDPVRVVTDIVGVLLSTWDLAKLDEVMFWRRIGDRPLDEAGIVTLTKFFVLEWSIEMEYQLYHQLPLILNLG